MKNFFLGKKILITGHTGFQGSWLTYILLQWGADITGISLDPTEKNNLFETLDLKNNINNYIFDICDTKKLNDVMQKHTPEIVFHLAAQALVLPSYEDPKETYQTNVMGTVEVLEAIKKKASVKSAVIITTDKVYKNLEHDRPYHEQDALGGYDPYSASKAAADIVTQSYIESFFNPETYGKDHNTLISIARSGNVIGGGDWANHRLIPDMVKAIYENDTTITLRNPGAIRPWQHVFEPLNGYMILAKKLFEGEKMAAKAWNFGPEVQESCSVEDLIKESINIAKKGSYKVIDSNFQHEAKILRLDITNSKKLLHWKPKISLYETLILTMDWYKLYYENKSDIHNITKQQIKTFFDK